MKRKSDKITYMEDMLTYRYRDKYGDPPVIITNSNNERGYHDYYDEKYPGDAAAKSALKRKYPNSMLLWIDD